ncbi:hypothetical protein ABH924_001109 [Arthrobacter sp. GAS37]|uniref:hypothetical protein n=1 Tax=Arthrobacter sp. GAS37 TaxID=3156261 RepID=UPI003833EC6C
MHPGADDATGRTAGLRGGFAADPSLSEREDLGIGDAVVRQIDKDPGSIGARASRLDQG